MKLVRSGSKNSPSYYIQKSVRIKGKSTTKTVERLGSIQEIKARAGDQDPLIWAENYTRELTRKEKEEKKDIIIKFSPSTLIDSSSRNSCNIGYLFLKDIYYHLGLNQISKHISSKYKFDYDLNDILSMLVFSRVIAPNSKRSSLKEAKNFLETPTCNLQDVYRSLEVISKENDFILSEIYKNSKNVLPRKTNILYYDCTNYYFEIEDEDAFRKYGVSKENKPNPIVQMGLFVDEDGIPLTFSLFEGNKNEQQSLRPLEKKIINDFETKEFIVCTDAGLSSTANRKFNDIQGRKFVTTQSIKKLKSFLKEFCLSDDGWFKHGSNQKYKLSQIDFEKEYNTVFYKSRWIIEDDIEQRLIVSYCHKYANYQSSIREKQVDRARKKIENSSKLNKLNQNDPRRFISSIHHTQTGELADKSIFLLDESKIECEAMYDGFYAVCTNLDVSEEKIIEINKKRWQIEESFRIMKNELKTRPVFLSRQDRIRAHFTTCFLALLIYRILEFKLGDEFSCSQIVKTLRNMNMLIADGDGYIPAYTRNDLTDALHEAFGFRTDYQIISQKNMRKILNQVKK